MNYKLVEKPWNFSEEVANSTSVCTRYRIRLHDAAECTFPSRESRGVVRSKVSPKKFIVVKPQRTERPMFLSLSLKFGITVENIPENLDQKNLVYRRWIRILFSPMTRLHCICSCWTRRCPKVWITETDRCCSKKHATKHSLVILFNYIFNNFIWWLFFPLFKSVLVSSLQQSAGFNFDAHLQVLCLFYCK